MNFSEILSDLYIERVSSGDHDHYLLPHEKRSILLADGVFRESLKSGDKLQPTEDSRILRIKKAAPLIGAQVVSYASEDENRVTLGSRVTITEGGDRFVVDIVGCPEIYPLVEDPDEPLKLSHRSPLARLIIGEVAGSGILQTKEIAEDVEINKVDQLSVPSEYPQDSVLKITFEY